MLGSSVNFEPEDMFSMEIDCSSIQVDPTKFVAENLSHTLDICHKKLFEFIKATCHDADGNLMYVNLIYILYMNKTCLMFQNNHEYTIFVM